MHIWMRFVVGMHLASAPEAERMTFEQLRYWFPLAKELSDQLDPKKGVSGA
jgi:hypothetical protein